MIWEKLLYDLRNLLSDLYPDEQSARRVASDAGLPVVFIDFDGSAEQFWSQVIRQAEIRGGLRALVDVALADYGDGKYTEELRRIKYIVSWYRGTGAAMNLPGGNIDPNAPMGERLASLEAKVNFLMVAVIGLYLGMFVLGILVITR